MNRAHGLQEQKGAPRAQIPVMPVLVFSKSCIDCACSERSGCAIPYTLSESQAASANEHPWQ